MQGRNEVRWRLGQEICLAPPCSNLSFFGSKCTVLEKVLMTLLWLFGPCSDSAPRELRSLAPSLRLWCYAIKIGKFSENKQIFKSERPELPVHEHLQFSNTIRHGSCTDCQQKLLSRYFRFLRVVFVSLLCLPHAFFRCGPVCFANNKSFPTFNKLLF